MDEDLTTHLLARDMQLGEIEGLTSRTPSWPHDISADELIDALFASLTAAARAEQLRVARPHVLDTVAKRNRRETYLDLHRRREWESCARGFLARSSNIVLALSTEALYSAVAMQHLLELDVADLSLPDEARCSDDSFICGINNQFLLDAPRCRYIVDNEVFHLAARPADELADAFAARLTRAVQRVTPLALLERVTTVMSQSGLAALERVSLCDVAVSGGSQKVEYSLARDSTRPGVVLLTLQVRKSRFSEFLVSSSGEEMSCDTDSYIQKTAKVAFNVNGDVDVVDFLEEIDIRQDGNRLPLESVCIPLPRCPPAEGDEWRSVLWRCLVSGARACVQWACCRRRRAGARDLDPGRNLTTFSGFPD